jgi:hypothetical protein
LATACATRSILALSSGRLGARPALALEGSQAPRGDGPRSADVEAVLEALQGAQLKQKQGPQMLHGGRDDVRSAEMISERIWRTVHAANGHERG